MKIKPFMTARQPFAAIPEKNPRSELGDRAFITALATSVGNDSASGGLEGLRRSVIGLTGEPIAKASFHERLSTRRLHNILLQALEDQTIGPVHSGSASTLLAKLGVTDIVLQDASTWALPKLARTLFPGVNTDKGLAALKLHFTFDLVSMKMLEHELSSGTANDSQYFPEVSGLVGKLIIADLGYYDFERFGAIDALGGFFLSRIKSNCSATVVSASSEAVAENLGLPINKTEWRKDLVDIECQFCKEPDAKTFRVVGCWNKEEQKYHWYVTNLAADARAIYPLYRARWQIELAFKALKQSLTPDRITTSVPMTIRNLILIYLIRFGLSSQISLCVELDQGDTNTQSTQMGAKVLNQIFNEFYSFIVNGTKTTLKTLREKLQLFKSSFVLPRNTKKFTTLQKLEEVLCST